MGRQEAYKLVQGHAQRALAGAGVARCADGRPGGWAVDQTGCLAALFDPRGQLQYIGHIFDRLGLVDGEKESAEDRQVSHI